MARNNHNQPDAEAGPRTDRIRVPQGEGKGAAVVVEDLGMAPPAPLRTDKVKPAVELTAVEQQVRYIDRAAQIRTKLLDHMDTHLGRYLAYLVAQGYYTEDVNGYRSFELPEHIQMTPDQSAAWKVMLNKLLPNFQPIRMDGKSPEEKEVNPLRDGTVHVTINQNGSAPDYKNLPGSVDGVAISHAQARQTSRIEFRGEEQVIVHPDGTTEPLIEPVESK